MAQCENMPLSFARHWQVIGQKGRQLWIGRHYLRILGPVDDVFGKSVVTRSVGLNILDVINVGLRALFWLGSWYHKQSLVNDTISLYSIHNNVLVITF